MSKNKIKLYLDTSIPNVLHDQRDLKLHRATQVFWRHLINFDVFISQTVIDEIVATTSKNKRILLEKSIKDFSVLEINKEVENLVDEYMKHKLVPNQDKNDAYHVAVASINRLDYLATWNLEHLAKEITRQKVMAVNLLHGYPEIKIVTPYDLLP